MKTHTLAAVLCAIGAAAMPGCGGVVDEAKPGDAAVREATVDAAAPPPDAGVPDANRPDGRPAPRDVGGPVQDACVPGPSIMDAGIPDAAVSADGGNTAACAACVAVACPSEVAACDAECVCNVAANQLFACLATGQSAVGCAQQVGFLSSPALQALGTCVLGAQQCRAACGVGPGFP